VPWLPCSGAAGHNNNGHPWVGGLWRKGSGLVRLLPFVEQGPFFNQIDFSRDVDAWFATLQPAIPFTQFSGRRPREFAIPTYICPSDPPARTDLALSNYGFSLGSQALPANATGCALYTNHLNGPSGHGNTSDSSQISGPFARFHWAARLADLTDGTSNTILMGEIRPNCSDHHFQGWAAGNGLWTSTVAPINFNTCRNELYLAIMELRRLIATVGTSGRLRRASNPSTSVAPSLYWVMVQFNLSHSRLITLTFNVLALAPTEWSLTCPCFNSGRGPSNLSNSTSTSNANLEVSFYMSS